MRGHVINRGKRNQSKKSNWGFVVDVGYDEQGKRKQLWRSGFASAGEAEKALAEALVDLGNGVYPSSTNKSDRAGRLARRKDRITVEEYLQEWLKKHEVLETTLSDYTWLLVRHVVPVIGDILLCNLKSEHVSRLYEEKKEYSLNTRQRMHGVLRSALNDAVEQKIIPINPCYTSLRPKAENVPKRSGYSADELDFMDEDELDLLEDMNAMTDDELARFIEAIKDTRFYVAHLLAVRRGLRRGEVLGLRWRDVDFQRRTLTIRRSLVVYKGKPLFHKPKTKGSMRTISLSLELAKALKEHKVKQDEEKAKRGVSYRDYGLLFPTIDGKPFDPNRFVKRHYKPLLAKAELPSFRYHDLRHTAATMMIKEDVNIKVLSNVLGHASEAFTLKVYGHLMPGMQEKALAGYDKK